jgi:ATP-independent RNA helicase DbpA
LLSGRKDKLRPGDVLGALVKDLGMAAAAVGRIDVAERSCAVALDRAEAGAAAGRKHLRVKKKKVRIRLLD